MLKPKEQGQFSQDVKLAKRRAKDMSKLRTVISMILQGTPLPAHYRDHPLHGKWKSYRELHMEGDWLLIYRVRGDVAEFARTGTHADLFGK